jgi:hypothetical protein
MHKLLLVFRITFIILSVCGIMLIASIAIRDLGYAPLPSPLYSNNWQNDHRH